MRKIRERFESSEIKNLMDIFKTTDEKEALEKWAYHSFDLKHNGSLILGRVGKSFVDIIEVD